MAIFFSLILRLSLLSTKLIPPEYQRRYDFTP